MQMRNPVILAVDNRDIDQAQSIIREIGDLFGGIMIPPWNLYTRTLELIHQAGAAIWFNPGTALPGHLQYSVNTYLTFSYPEYPLDGLLTFCYSHLMKQLPEFVARTMEKHRQEYHPPLGEKNLKPVWPLPMVFGIASLTTEDPDERILLRITRAQLAGLNGVIVPCNMVEATHQAGMEAMIIGIRDPNWLVEEDDQVITCTPKQARLSGADLFVIGRPITSRPSHLQKIAAKFFVSALTGGF